MPRLPKFDYFEPKTVEEACSLLDQHREKAKLVAGGTDLLVRMKQRTMMPQCLINLKRIPNLDYVHYDGREGMRIGSLTRLRDIETSPVIQKSFPILADATSMVSSIQVQNMATVGGNLCNASPAADTAPPLIGLGARVRIISVSSERYLPLEDFFVAPGKTALKSNEICTEIHIPNLPPRTGGAYLKLSARNKDIAIVNVAVIVTLDLKDGSCSDVKVVLGAVGPTVIRARKAENILKGNGLGHDLIERASALASGEVHPISDVRGSAEYRIQMVKVLTKRTVEKALKLAGA